MPPLPNIIPAVLRRWNRRRYERTPFSGAGVVILDSGVEAPCRIINYSPAGVRLSTPKLEAQAIGQHVKLRWSVPSRRGAAQGEHEATIVEMRGEDGSSPIYGLRFRILLDERLEEMSSRTFKLMAAIGASILAAFIVYLKSGNLLWFWYLPTFKFYSVVATAFFFSRIALFLFYRNPLDNGYTPTVAVVIAAMNEEDAVVATVEHVYATRYLKHLMEVVVVDDGSTDKTWEKLEGLKARFPGLKLIRFEKNRGKRHAMAEGLRNTTGEIVVFVDSDSAVEAEGVYRLVQPFFDESVGAVAGHILVNVEGGGFIAKMESVRYYVSHRILKACESLFGAVTCCSGAFSAYRRSVVDDNLEAWLAQKFMGVQTTFGDDRSLTNYVLKTHRVLFHNGARCATNVPATWGKYFRQQLRWKKSWTRETLVTCGILYKEHPVAAVSYYVGVFLTLVAPVVVLHWVVYMPLVSRFNPLQYVAGLCLSYLCLSLVCFYLNRSRYCLYGIVFPIVYVFVLCWQNYYAMLTINKTGWGTRG